MNKSVDRENLGQYYRRCFDFFKGQSPLFDARSVECFLNLIRTTEMVRTAVDGRMRKFNLTGPSFGILSLLESAPGKRLTMNQIGEQMLVTQANVTGLVDTLECRGLVQRRSDPKDRRVRSIRITRSGSMKLRRILPGHTQFIHALFKAFTPAAKASVIAKLKQVRVQLLKMLLFLVLAGPWPLAVAFGAGAPPKELTLAECYRLAARQSESLMIQSEKIVQLLEKYKAGRGAVLPNIRFLYTEFFQDTTGVDTSIGGVGNTLTRSERPEAKLQLAQPLFSGFRDWAGLAYFKSQKEKEEFIYRRAKEDLFQGIANAFYLVIQGEKDLENVRSIMGLSRERVDELDSRVRLGKSRESEVLNAESQLASLRAQEESLQAQLATDRERLSLLVGTSLEGVRLVDPMTVPSVPGSLENYLSAVSTRTDIQALQKEVESKTKLLKAAKRAHSPTIDLLGSYYLKRVGFQEPIDWDVLVTLGVPIFQGGATQAAVREAASELREAEWNLKRAARETTSQIRQNYMNLKSSISQVSAFEKAYQKVAESYRLNVKEYRHGLVNNLEVLQTMNLMQDAKRNFDRTVVQTKLNMIDLEVSTERVPEVHNEGERP